MLNPIDPWAHGDALTAAHLQQQVEAINQISALLGGDGLETVRTPGGSTAKVNFPITPVTWLFPVRVECTNSASGDGTLSTPASYVYTVRQLEWNETGNPDDFIIDTVVGLSRPRPNGKMTPQAGSTGLGVCFYDNGSLNLWDAGEVPTTGPC